MHNIPLYLPLFLDTYVCVCIYLYTYIHKSTNEYTYAYLYIHIYIYIYVCISILTDTVIAVDQKLMSPAQTATGPLIPRHFRVGLEGTAPQKRSCSVHFHVAAGRRSQNVYLDPKGPSIHRLGIYPKRFFRLAVHKPCILHICVRWTLRAKVWTAKQLPSCALFRGCWTIVLSAFGVEAETLVRGKDFLTYPQYYQDAECTAKASVVW